MVRLSERGLHLSESHTCPLIPCSVVAVEIISLLWLRQADMGEDEGDELAFGFRHGHHYNLEVYAGFVMPGKRGR